MAVSIHQTIELTTEHVFRSTSNHLREEIKGEDGKLVTETGAEVFILWFSVWNWTLMHLL